MSRPRPRAPNTSFSRFNMAAEPQTLNEESDTINDQLQHNNVNDPYKEETTINIALKKQCMLSDSN